MKPVVKTKKGEDREFEDFFENSLNGYLLADPEGYIRRANPRLAGWLGVTPQDLQGRRFSDCLTIGGRIYCETHLFPLLRMQGWIEEVSLELAPREGGRIPVFVNALECRNKAGKPVSLRITVFKGVDRSRYEENLRHAHQLAEANLAEEREAAVLKDQFIAVLGHDLCNPLTAIITGVNVLGTVSPLNEKGSRLAEMILESAAQMNELIRNVMDFACGRLGGGIPVDRFEVPLEPLMRQVIEEAGTGHSGRIIVGEFDVAEPVDCDPVRISQLLSHLVENALIHGAPEGVVRVRASIDADTFELSVENTGPTIPEEALGHLFQPFARNQVRPSLQGLGLGLYIASEIARAHGGTLKASSDEEETRFTFRMPLAAR